MLESCSDDLVNFHAGGVPASRLLAPDLKGGVACRQKLPCCCCGVRMDDISILLPSFGLGAQEYPVHAPFALECFREPFRVQGLGVSMPLEILHFLHV